MDGKYRIYKAGSSWVVVTPNGLSLRGFPTWRRAMYNVNDRLVRAAWLKGL